MRELKTAYNNWTCPSCKLVFRTRRLLEKHRSESIDCKSKRGGHEPFVDCQCSFCNRKFKRKSAKTLHEKSCRKNPHWIKGHTTYLSNEAKQKISESMKRAHKEGRAGSFPSRKNCEHSYPEKWLIGVLERECLMKEHIDYQTEYYFHKQFLDFAWVGKKLCIEIDGAQHKRSQKRIENDHKKDENLKNDGWKELRLDWNYIINNTQEAIQKIKEFLVL